MRRLALGAALVLATAGCGSGGDPGRTTVVLHGDTGPTTLAVEVADTDGERERGLMGRDRLGVRSGMLFVFPDPSSDGFWMKDTRIPLSVAFVDARGRVLGIRDMAPCRRDPCRVYRAPGSYRLALEVNRGAFRRWAVRPGSRIATDLLP